MVIKSLRQTNTAVNENEGTKIREGMSNGTFGSTFNTRIITKSKNSKLIYCIII